MTTCKAVVIFIAGLQSLARGQSLTGNKGCPCLGADYFDELSENQLDIFEKNVGAAIDPREYGIGCHAHDIDALECSDAKNCTTIVPLPPACDKSYCKRSWCFVDPQNCSKTHSPSKSQPFKGRHYSYATCGELDLFTYTERLQSLKDKTFQVGYSSNSGGWKGAYNPSGSFAVNNQWTGPAVEFINEVALMGKFNINMTQPPEWLRNNSKEFFGDSKFDFCVYAVSLGYLDFCVGAFSISEKRSSITTMFEIANDPVYLITFSSEGEQKTDWESFKAASITVFQPFTPLAWIMIFAFCLPILGMLMFFHEYGAPGSAYPRNEAMLLRRENGGAQPSNEAIRRKIPMFKHLSNSLYMGTLSFFQGSYDQSVVTVGGKINLLAIASFIMLILAVYTANLAAILTQDANKPVVDSIEMAVKQGMNICAERKLADFAIDFYGLNPSTFVPDPIELGGDGEPGFNCPKCKARERIFSHMRQSHDDPTQYCNVAIASQEDIDVLHGYGSHCDKTKVGESIHHRSIGIPIYDRHADALVSLLHKSKADSIMTKTLASALPKSQCPETGGEGSALNVQQLTGVWVITFSFALIALLAKFILSCPLQRNRLARVGTKNITTERRIPFNRYDQWGNPAPYDVVINGYKYDPESDELLEVTAGVSEAHPLAQTLSNTEGLDFDCIVEEENSRGDGTSNVDSNW
eukprot:CAMPEP_0183713660 /NCGR_PEP_ID=MMETSP0737-20130205/8441_1 /TAXON_ID=385413 /ORGANISM="Thalassiosira miniscula, Strain CCMP1093" /LENGTH=692 /DNA_ID=CAMNT_0025942479 /DNA_START=189 /DNA_END=2264 /DNA_ORIENTATION=+